MQNIPKELWMMVPAQERAILIEHFNIPKTGITEVHDNTVVSDGYSTDDLRILNAESLAEFVGSSSEESMMRLWELTVAKAHSIANPPMGVIEAKPEVVDDGGAITIEDTSNGAIIEEPVTEPTHAPAKKAGRPKKK